MTAKEQDKKDISGFRPELFALAAEKAAGGKALPPVHLWHPEFCGDIDMHIHRDGSWDYMGTPITRIRMVKLFSTVLRRDADDYFLVTPVEKVGIRVDDAPFVAVEMEHDGNNIIFKTNLDDYVTVDADHPIFVTINEKTGEPSPYVRVRDRLDALLSRSVYYQLVDLAEEVDGEYGVTSDGVFFNLGGN